MFIRLFLRPDIVIDNGKIVADAKWKLLDSNKSNTGIPQAYMYQMYVYKRQFHRHVVLTDEIAFLPHSKLPI